jgi:TRAP-type C4-dicarboxylate transport system substrate-binding protein
MSDHFPTSRPFPFPWSRPGRLLLALLACVLLAAQPAVAQRVKMATLVPKGSSWHNIVKEMGARWKQLSAGRVKLVIYPGGVAGDDPDVVRKMRLGTLHAGLLTAVGIAEIDPAVYALGVPLMYASYEEVYHVLEKMRPGLEAKLAKKGFVVLNWADGGWNQFFTKKPVVTPDDLRALKLFTWAGDSDTVGLYKSAGFNPIPLPATEIATALRTGLVEALTTPPQVAVISQFYNQAKNMTDLRWQLLLGAMVIRTASWNKLPADLRPALLEAAREAGKRLREEVRKSGDRDVEAMRKRGLNVVPVDANTRKLWLETAEGLYPEIRGKIVPAEAFDEAMKYRDAYRQAHPSSGTR